MDLIKQFLPFITLIGQVGIVILLLSNLIGKPTKWLHPLIHQHSLMLAFIVALTATLGSLFYSEIAGFEPCKLCWFQRIAMYPLVVLLGWALAKKDKTIHAPAAILATIGAAIALYHYYIQLTFDPTRPCPVGGTVSCVQKVTFHYGYISIPLMALTAFVLIILLLGKTVSSKK